MANYQSKHTGQELDQAIDYMKGHRSQVEQGIAALESTYQTRAQELRDMGGKAEDVETNDGGNVEEKLVTVFGELLSKTITQEVTGDDSTFKAFYFRGINPEVEYSVVFNNAVTNMATASDPSFLQIIRHNNGLRTQVYTWSRGQMYEVGKKYIIPLCDTIEIAAKWGKTETMSVSIVHEGLDHKVQEIADNLNNNTARLDKKIDGVAAFQESNEYMRVYTDAKGRLLWWIDYTGNVGWSKGVPEPIRVELKKLEQLIKDNTEGDETIDARVAAIETKMGDLPVYEECGEYASVCLDKNKRLLWWVDREGNVGWSKGIPGPIQAALDEKSDKKDATGTYMESPVFTKMLLDRNGRIVEAMNDAGEIHHYSAHIFEKFKLKDSGLIGGVGDLVNELKKAGFTGGAGDWSDEKLLELPIPRKCALVNIVASHLPVSKTENTEARLQFWDMDGNYFNKPVILNAQGNSSMALIEKNFTVDLDDKSTLKFGNWVAQDSFHFKAYYIDVLRGVCNIGYKWTNELIEHLGCRVNRLLHTTSATPLTTSGSFADDFGSDAKCQPDGFPIEVYFNGEYHGLYAWNLKKHRDNYEMDKNDYSQAILDGRIDAETFFNASINWAEFELRNPKTLYCMDGTTKYDGDAPQEIIGTEAGAYNPGNVDHVKTAALKARLVRISNVIPTLKATTDLDAARAIFESHFDKKMLTAYFIGANVLYHSDGFAKNWIWTIYDTIAAPTFYDMDSIFGRSWTGAFVVAGSTDGVLGTSTSIPTGQLYRLYKDEIRAVWAELRNSGVVSVERIMSHVYAWTNTVGRSAYARNLAKWTMIPSYRADGGNYPIPYSFSETETRGMYDSPTRIKAWLEARISSLDTYFKFNN